MDILLIMYYYYIGYKTYIMFTIFGEEDLFSHEKKSTKTQLIKLCTKGRVKKKQ